MDSAVARILDANANRAREAFRVLEDFARFDLNDVALSARIKEARHQLADALGGELSKLVIRARDVESDVGRRIETATEYVRDNVADVVMAAGKRATEAVRVMEEYVKTFDAGRARAFERLRYAVYDIERAVAVRIQARDRFGRVRLYVLLTESLCSGPWLPTAEQAVEGGADCIQLREKTLPDNVLLERTRILGRMCRKAGVLLIVNDRPDIARLGGADGVHVGRGDLPVSDARRIVGPSALVGVSTHTIEQARQAMSTSPDYLAVGPMFATTTKPQDRVPGPALVQGVRSETSLPVVAIGGIDAENVATVLEAGATCICVCRAVILQPDVAGAAAKIKTRIDEHMNRLTANGEDSGGV